MPSHDAGALEMVRDAFASVPRPEHFTNYRHCDECLEHDELLQQRDCDTLTMDDMGSGSWDPITMTTPEAFAYLMPGLARLALQPEHEKWGWYGDRLAFQLRWNGPRNERWQFCSPAMREAVVALFEYLIETRQGLIEDWNCSEEFLDTVAIWSDTGD